MKKSLSLIKEIGYLTFFILLPSSKGITFALVGGLIFGFIFWLIGSIFLSDLFMRVTVFSYGASSDLKLSTEPGGLLGESVFDVSDELKGACLNLACQRFQV